MRRLELNLVSNLILHNTKMCIEGYCQFSYDDGKVIFDIL
jgi:hypothetical protein